MSASERKPTVLITGASSAIARLVSSAISAKYELVGVDPRPLPSSHHFSGTFYEADYYSRKLDEVFRKHRFSTVLHLGRIRESLKHSSHYRFQMNVIGTQKLLDLCKLTGVQNLVVLSTYHVYGAHRLNALHMTEDAPLKASQNFPELVDAVEMDHAATTFMWKHRDVRTTILRPVNVIGKHVRNTICSLLRSGVCPKIMGFDPLMQFIDEKDIARAIILTLDQNHSGAFNVTGEGVIPYSHAIMHAQAVAVPIPPFVTPGVVRVIDELGGFGFPPYLMDFLKYPTVVSDEAFRSLFGYQPRVKTVQSLKSLGPIAERARVKIPKTDETV